MRGSFHTPTLSLLALVLVLSACEKKKTEEPKLAQINEAIPNLTLPQGATFVSRSGSADALSIVFRAPDEPDAIVGGRFLQCDRAAPGFRTRADAHADSHR